MNVPLDIIESRLATNRAGSDRDYLKGKVDIHEDDFELQRRVHHTYLNLRDISGYTIGNYKIIDCGSQTPEEIFSTYVEDLTKLVQ